MRTFTATIRDTESQLQAAISLPGWSHSSTYKYDDTTTRRRIWFKAKHRTEAACQCRCHGVEVRDLVAA